MRVEPTPSLRPLPSPAPQVHHRPAPARLAVATSAYGRIPELDGDVEVSVRVFAEGGSVTVMRRTALDADGVTRRTIGIEAMIR